MLPVRASVRLRLLVEAHLRGPAVGSALGGCASRAAVHIGACTHARHLGRPQAQPLASGYVAARF